MDAFASASVGAFLGSFFAAMAIFSVPITLLGMASPFAVRLGVETVEKAGEVAGRMYALSTAGSILGTFIPVAILIPVIGTRRTMLVTAALLALVAAPALGRRYVLVPAAIAALALLPPGLVKPGSGVIYETESPYQFIQVVQRSDGSRVLHLNEGWAEHSVWRPNTVMTGGYWDQFLLAPVIHGTPIRDLAMVGYAGGTVGRAYGQVWPDVNVLGHRAGRRRHRRRPPLPRARRQPARAGGDRRRPRLPARATTPATTRSSWTPSASPTSPST